MLAATLPWCLGLALSSGDEPLRAEPIAPFLNGALPSRTPTLDRAWEAVEAFPNLEFVEPIDLARIPGTNRYALATAQGNLFHFANDPDTDRRRRMMRLRPQVDSGDKDSGFVSIVFHPRFTDPSGDFRFLYAFYRYTQLDDATGGRAYLRLSRFDVPESLRIEEESEQVLIQQYDRHYWHNGGGLAFGPDGFLYVCIGDEGGSFDGFASMRGLSDGLFGGVLRIDVDQDLTRSHPIRRQPRGAPPPDGWPQTFTANYTIPNDNPWQDPGGSVLEEFWCYGLRSPHQMHFDELSGDLWVGDVGQDRREEINLIQRGGNYQWPYKEGSLDTGVDSGTQDIGFEVPPFLEYPRTEGACVIGGDVYRGPRYAPELGGKLLFADHISSRLWAIDRQGRREDLGVLPTGGHGAAISAFAEDFDGEVLFLKWNGVGLDGGKIYKLVQRVESDDVPARLSELGAFTDLATMTPAPGLHPYGVNSPLWSDAAVKSRWVAVPNDGVHDSPEEKVGFSTEGPLSVPVGTVLVKHFEVPTSVFDPTQRRRVETRFLVHDQDGDFYGLSYRWREDGSDADFVGGREQIAYQVEEEDGLHDHVWDIPSVQDCRSCHTEAAQRVLGFSVRQLNGDFRYPGSGRPVNQLEALGGIGLFDRGPIDAAHEALPALVDPLDRSRALDDRARSYLDANCAHCHRPGGNVNALFDARWETPLAVQDLLRGPTVGDFAPLGSSLIFPGSPEASVVHQRVSARGEAAMPPLGRNRVDEEALRLLRAWIADQPTRSLAGPWRFVRLHVGSSRGGGATTLAELTLLDAAGRPLDPRSLRVSFASGEGEDERRADLASMTHAARRAVDGDPSSFWSTPEGLSGPHELVLDLGEARALSGLRHLPRQDGSDEGRIVQYRVHLSRDGRQFGPAVAAGVFPDGDGETTISFAPEHRSESKIVRAADDGQERADGTVRLQGSRLSLGSGGEDRPGAGLRFALDVPRGARILEAFVQFTAADTDKRPARLRIAAGIADDAAPFVDVDGNLSSREVTAAEVAWEPEVWVEGERGAAQRSPDLAALIQDVVSRPGWQAGQHLSLLLRGLGHRDAEAFSTSGKTEPARLVVRWR